LRYLPIANSAAFTFNVSKIVSAMGLTIYSKYVSTNSSKVTSPVEESSTDELIRPVYLVGPIAPTTKRSFDGSFVVTSLQTYLSNFAVS